jgi:hypothetical protein
MLETMIASLRHWVSDAVVQPLMEPVLHPSHWRIRAIGCPRCWASAVLLLWGIWLPQPYETFDCAADGALGLQLLVDPGRHATPPDARGGDHFPRSSGSRCPGSSSWMYFCNGGNPVWLASTGAMLLIYYHLTDWRLATVGAATGLLAAGSRSRPSAAGAAMSAAQVATNVVVLGFCWLHRHRAGPVLVQPAARAAQLHAGDHGHHGARAAHAAGHDAADRRGGPQRGARNGGESGERLQQLGSG